MNFQTVNSLYRNILRVGVAVPILALLLLAMQVVAQDDDEGSASAGEAIYIALQPAFVVNYGGVGRLKYLKTELSVRVQDVDAANSVRHHMPLIRNNLVLLFSRQTDETLGTQAGKENLRQVALQEVRSVVEQEDGSSGVVDLYFNNFIIQK